MAAVAQPDPASPMGLKQLGWQLKWSHGDARGWDRGKCVCKQEVKPLRSAAPRGILAVAGPAAAGRSGRASSGPGQG